MEKEIKEIKQRVYTGGDVEVQNIKVGDIHYEIEYGHYIKVEVITLPESKQNLANETNWRWKSKKVNDGKIINYLVTEGYAHYAPKLYTTLAYQGLKEI